MNISDDVKQYLEFKSVKKWVDDVGYSNPGREKELEMVIRWLSKFCQSQNKNPDELVASCFRQTASGDVAVSAKGRREIDRMIDEFVESQSLAGFDAVFQGNRIREFLIHNGVFMQGKVAYP